MQISDFDYDLPTELIAQQPLERRDASRMLVLDRERQTLEDSVFEKLPEYLQPGDVMVLNNTRVFPARLIGQRDPSGGRVEVLLTREIEPANWEALVRPAQRLKNGDRLRFGDSQLRAEVLESSEKGMKLLRFENAALLEGVGQTPLPPYIKRPAGSSFADRERYQTVYARNKGAIAAPTAGLHFTEATIQALLERQIRIEEVTLHVGYGTFEPVRVDEIKDHTVAEERFQIGADAASTINAGRASGGRVIAVGTTTTRALESAADSEGKVERRDGETGLTITPGYEFRAVDGLLTNFHLPRSSLLMLVSAFAGHAFTLNAYRHAVAERYRFYSYGDCMLVI